MVRQVCRVFVLTVIVLLMAIVPLLGQWLAVDGPPWIQAGWMRSGPEENDALMNGPVLAVVILAEAILLVSWILISCDELKERKCRS